MSWKFKPFQNPLPILSGVYDLSLMYHNITAPLFAWHHSWKPPEESLLKEPVTYDINFALRTIHKWRHVNLCQNWLPFPRLTKMDVLLALASKCAPHSRPPICVTSLMNVPLLALYWAKLCCNLNIFSSMIFSIFDVFISSIGWTWGF